MANTQTITINELKRCPIQFRPVCRESLDYITLRDSIRKYGVLVALLVRPKKGSYEVVDGTHRYDIALLLRLSSLPCTVQEMTDEEVLTYQLMIQANRIEPTTIEYARRLWRIINIDQSMSLNELASQIKKHPGWVQRKLNLVKLSPESQKHLTKGYFGVAIGGELCKLPHSKQDELLSLLESMPQKEFRELVVEQARHHRQGKKDRRVHQKTHYKWRSFKEVVNELENPTVAASVLTNAEATTALDGWKAHAEWVLKRDLASVAEDLQQQEKDQAMEAAKLERRNAEHLNRKRD